MRLAIQKYAHGSLFALLALIPPAAAQDFPAAEIEKLAIQELAERKIPGAAIAIVRGDRVVYSKGFGVESVETDRAVTGDTLFAIGSTTKLFTAYVIAAMAQDGSLKLNQSIRMLIPGLSPALGQVTPHQLLTHTSGLFDSVEFVLSSDEDALEHYARSLDGSAFFTEPGAVYSYANPGFNVLGLLVEKVSRRPFADAIREKLFRPLRMNRTTFRPNEAMTYPLAQGHSDENHVLRPFEDSAAERPTGGALSTANELARFSLALLNGGQLEGRQVLSREVIRALTTPRVPVHSRFSKGSYGYGLFLHQYRGVSIAEHGGGLPGFTCSFRIFPEHRFALVILVNKPARGGMPPLPKTAERILEAFLPLQPKEPATTTAGSVALSDSEKLDLTGFYRHPPVSVEIMLDNGELHWRQGEAKLRIVKVGEDRFQYLPPGSASGQEFVVVRGRSGRPAFIHIALHAFGRLPDGGATTR